MATTEQSYSPQDSPPVTDQAAACPAPPSAGHADPFRWWAIVCRPSWAFSVRERIQARGIQTYLPTYQVEVRWSDRIKTVDRQLFPGYLFVRCRQAPSFHAGEPITGLLDVLKPSIPDEQISAVLKVLASRLTPLPCRYLSGQRVEIASGPLAGVTGTVVKTEGQMKVVVGIEMLGRAVSVAIDAEDLKRP